MTVELMPSIPVGGMVSIAAEYRGAGAAFVEARVAAAGERLRAVLDEAGRDERMPLEVAREHALHAIAVAGGRLTNQGEC